MMLVQDGVRRAHLRDQRGWGGGDPQIVVFHHSWSRSGETAQPILREFTAGTLSVDGHSSYDILGESGCTAKPWMLAIGGRTACAASSNSAG